VATLKTAAHLTGADALRWAISGGEDYELLFTAGPGDSEHLARIAQQCGQTIFPVGAITAGRGVTLIQDLADGTSSEIAVAYQGFDHFR
jgi:thiamine-monophosphate kinase